MCLIAAGSFAQQLRLNLSKGNTCLFGGNIFSFGLSNQKQGAAFCIYKIDMKLKIKDSLIINTGKAPAENYLDLYADTLHNYLNIYLQQKETKTVKVLRFNKKSELLATVENIDVARLNNTAMFSSENLYFKNAVYTIKIQSDTSGKQFYLNKHELRSETANFDYTFSWQFPFEKKYIHAAHIFYANKNHVLVYVYVDSGPKTGQWVLKINAATGKLIRGTKLNARAETASYLFNDFIADTVSGNIHLLGQKFTGAQFNQKENQLAISNAAFATVYLVSIDSAGDVTDRHDFKIPIISASIADKKTTANYLLRMSNARQNKEGRISFETDVYKSTGNALSYLYTNTSVFNLVPVDDKMVLEKNAITVNPLIEKYYFTNDKLDINGKLSVDSLDQFEKIFYKSITFPVKQAFKTDTDNNPSWILTKISPKKNTVNYTFLSPVKKIYQLTVIDEVLKSANPVLIPIADKSFLTGRQQEENVYLLKLFGW